MLKKVLIANRGEIAVRIIRGAREAGIASVAVYADPDIDAVHTGLADEAFALYGATPAESYLSIEKLMEVARISGADSVHPGYGFLSESAEFAAAVQAAGLRWIGPGPEAITLLGNKAGARSLAQEVGAPLVPGSDGPVNSAEDVLAFADAHGLPLIIKAVHGGGGRGMRVVHSMDEIPEAFAAAVREAVAAFGRGECLVEKFLERPRHIEAQVLGDSTGRVAVLGTRDCSLQRRNQKLVEEAPAPFLEDSVREAVHTAAEAICRAAGYVGAGTVEFLLGADGTLTFLEVNTRLQVEHPITELVTGIDLVQEQFRIAAGEAMRVPDEVASFGHAVEMRINAEDPGLGFLPTPGRITRFDVPGGPGVRVDSGVVAGTVVPASFDSLLGKLIVWGRDRDEALARARRAIAEFHVEGVATVLPFHRAVFDDPAFLAPEGHGFAVHTTWIEEESGFEYPPAPASDALPAAGLTRLPIEVDGRRITIGLPEGLLNGIASQPLTHSGTHDGGSGDPADTAGGAAEDAGRVVAPFSAVVSKWVMADGSSVLAGDTVLLLEAMKMEVPLRALRDGILTHVASAGAAVEASEVLGRVN